ncbi:MAG: phosphomannomutase/phosphoglucomutase, partial [Nanobdellota archaeon]
MGIFKKYDIRGIYPDEIDEDNTYRIARAYVELIREETGKNDLSFVVGRDMRLSSPKLTEKVIDGLTDGGADVVDIGLASTPTFYFAVGKYGHDGGVQISASHNPKEYNGLKLVRAKAYPIGLDNGLDWIRDNHKQEFRKYEKGRVDEEPGVVEEVVSYSKKFYDFDLKPLKVVCDVANAMSSIDLNSLFGELPCELVRMNFEL